MKNLVVSKFLFGAIVLFSFACEVSEDEPAVMDSNGNEIARVGDSEILANDSTNFRVLITDTASKTWNASFFSLMGLRQSCRLDDVMMFFDGGTYQYSSGPQLCMAEDSQRSRTGTWEIDYKNRVIIFDKGGVNEYRADVIGLSEDELRLKGTYNGMEVRGLYSKN